MKLVELIKEKFGTRIENGETRFGYNDLVCISNELQNCEEFYYSRLIIYDASNGFITENTGKVSIPTMHFLYNNNKYHDINYLCQISLSPSMYNLETIYQDVLDGCCITPVMYDIKTFTPYKKIVLNYSIEEFVKSNDSYHVLTESEIRTKIHEKLDHILDNVKKYEPKGIRGINLRGKFNFTAGIGSEQTKYK